MKVKLLEGATPPARSFALDMGFDLLTSRNTFIAPHKAALLETGVCVEIPAGHFGLIVLRGGFAKKNHVTLISGVGTMQAGFCKPIALEVRNFTGKPVTVKKKQRMAKLFIMPCVTPEIEIVDELEPSNKPDKPDKEAG